MNTSTERISDLELSKNIKYEALDTDNGNFSLYLQP